MSLNISSAKVCLQIPASEISNKHIKELIKEICDEESKKSPFSDDKIASMLKEKGIHIARRTVAKYREQLKIPVAVCEKNYDHTLNDVIIIISLPFVTTFGTLPFISSF
jgi:DNA-directed RNA polymerase specialized sigma54-like protein